MNIDLGATFIAIFIMVIILMLINRFIWWLF